MNTRQHSTIGTTPYASLFTSVNKTANKTMMPSAGDLRGWIARACALVERRPGAGIG